MQNGETQVGS